MAVAAADVKKLRDATGAGMMDAKKALEEADGDFEKATEILRVSGAVKQAKRGAERTASAGLVVRSITTPLGAVLPLNHTFFKPIEHCGLKILGHRHELI